MGSIIVEYGVYGAAVFTVLFSIFVIVYVKPEAELDKDSNGEDANNK